MSSFFSYRKKRILLKILSYISTASLLLTFVILPMQPKAHADIVDLDDMGAAGMITGYGAWNGTSLAYEIYEGVSNTFQTAGELIEGLWNQAYVELGTLPTYQSLSEYYASGVLQQYPVVGNTYTEIIINETTAQALDIFWDWALTQEGFTRNEETDLLEPPVDYVPSPIKHALSWHSEGVSAFNIPAFNFTAPENLLLDSQFTEYPFSTVYGDVVAIFAYSGQANNGWRDRTAIFASPSSGSIVRVRGSNYQLSSSITWQGQTVYYANASLRPYDYPTSGSCNPFLNYDTSGSGGRSQIAWAMVYGDDYESWLEISVPVNHDLILLPNPYAEDYVPQPVTIPTFIPYPPEYAPLPAPVPDPITGDFPEDAPSPSAVAQAVAQPMMQGAIDGDLVQDNPELDPEPDPTPVPSPGSGSGDPIEVVTPVLPFTLPSFNFSLSGIWHYVVEWVGTLGSWFSLVFTIWSHLPYAIVVPVYATAVVVIVLGVYKRFFM